MTAFLQFKKNGNAHIEQVDSNIFRITVGEDGELSWIVCDGFTTMFFDETGKYIGPVNRVNRNGYLIIIPRVDTVIRDEPSS